MLDSSYKLFKSSRYLSNNLLLATVSSISAIIIQGISTPPCTDGDHRYLVLDNFVVMFAPRSKINFVTREIFIGKCSTDDMA